MQNKVYSVRVLNKTLEGTRIVGEHLGVAGRLSGTVSPFTAEQGSSLEMLSLEEEMATHSSVLAWRIPGMGEPGGRHGVSREVPCSALNGETVPDSLPATPKSPPRPGSRVTGGD